MSDGEIDNSFTPYIFQQTNSSFRTFALQSDDSLIIGDLSGGIMNGTVPNSFSRVLSDGTLDTKFNAGGIGFHTINPGSVGVITVQPDEKILIGGKFDSVNNEIRIKLARLNPDATLDTSFQINVSGTDNSFTSVYEIYHIAAQADGKIIVSGFFTYKINGVTVTDLVRLNSDGSIDTTFNLGGIICCSGEMSKPVTLDNGKLLYAKPRQSYSGASVLLLINSDGSIDPSFNASIFPDATRIQIMDMLVQPDGKIILSGEENRMGDKSFILRFNSDGSIDETFEADRELYGDVSKMVLLPDGKIIVVLGYLRDSLRKINADGSLDNSFNVGTGLNSNFNAILRTSNGKIFVGGKFSYINGELRQNLAKLNEDGSLDPITYSVNDEVLSLAIDSSGRVLVGGKFTTISVNGGSSNYRSYTARLVDSASLARKRFDFDGDGNADLGVFNNTNGVWDIFNSQTNQAILNAFWFNQ